MVVDIHIGTLTLGMLCVLAAGVCGLLSQALTRSTVADADRARKLSLAAWPLMAGGILLAVPHITRR